MHLFRTAMGVHVPDVGADRMRDLDRVAVDAFGIDLLQTMENAGRTLAATARGMLHGGGGVTVLAGSGGNGGGGLAAARHLHGRAVEVRVILARPEDHLSAASAHQLRTLRAIGVPVGGPAHADRWIGEAELAIDALLGYGAAGPAEGTIADLIHTLNRRARRIVSLDLPSGLHATLGTVGGPIVRPVRTLTLALPKTGLADPAADLADIGIPPEAFHRIGLTSYLSPFRTEDRVPLQCTGTWSTRCRDVASPR